MRIALVLSVTLLVADPARALDVEPWDRVLQRYARGGGVDYAALAADPDGRADLERFVASLATMDEDEPLASWLNAYDALVVHAIVQRWPLASVRSVPHFFDGIRYRVAGRDRTLDDIEHRVIRVRFRDARVHAALVCGARSCPPLHPRAFRQDSLDPALDRLARAWVASPRHVRVEGAVVRASAIFGWYRADFERDAGSVTAWIERYGRDLPDGAILVEMEYDWSINVP